MKVFLTLEAIDRASRVINAVGSSVEKLAALQDRINSAKDRARADFFDKAAGVTASVAPLIKANKVFAEFEDKLTDVGLKGELAGKKLMDFGLEMIALSPKVNKTATDLLTGVDKLVEGGMKFDAARAIIGPIAKTSVATKAEMDDLSKTAVTLVNNLQVIPKEIQRSLDVMAQSGKEGQFELKAMAQYFPRLGAQYAAMGQTGVKAVADLAAALQVIRGQTGKDETAVVALEDVLNKITLGPAKKKFEEAGIDIVDVMNKAQKAGTVIETMVEMLNKLTKNDPGKLNEVFSDKQALAGARALVQQFDKFIEIRKKALGATGVNEADFATRMGLQVEKMTALKVAMDNFWLALGQVVAPVVGAVVTKMTEWLNALTGIIQAHPELTKWVLGAAVAFTALFAALAAIKLGALIFLSGLSAVARVLMVVMAPLRVVWSLFAGIASGIASGVAAMGGWAAVAGGIAARFAVLGRFLAAPFMLAGRAVMMLGAALLATPVGWVVAAIAAIAGAAYLIYQHWGAIGLWLANLWETIKVGAQAAWAGFVAWVASIGSSIAEAFSSAWLAVTSAASGAWNGVIDALKSGWTAASTAIGSMSDSLLAPLQAAWGKVTGWFAALTWPELPKFEIFDKIGAAFDSFLAKIEAGWNKLTGLFANMKLPSISMPSWLGGSGPGESEVKATDASARAARASVEAIAPAAQAAMASATAAVSSVSFYSQGVAMMETLAAGIRAGSASAVSAVNSTVQQIRDHLPHSPAKTGPLSDLDRVQFSQTLASAIDAGAPRAIAAARAVAAGLAATVPVSAAAPGFAVAGATLPASGGAGGAGGAGAGAPAVHVNFSVNLTGGAGADLKAELERALPGLAYQLTEIVKRELDRRDRVSH